MTVMILTHSGLPQSQDSSQLEVEVGLDTRSDFTNNAWGWQCADEGLDCSNRLERAAAPGFSPCLKNEGKWYQWVDSHQHCQGWGWDYQGLIRPQSRCCYPAVTSSCVSNDDTSHCHLTSQSHTALCFPDLKCIITTTPLMSKLTTISFNVSGTGGNSHQMDVNSEREAPERCKSCYWADMLSCQQVEGRVANAKWRVGDEY